MRHQGKTAIVTGGASGIGRGIVERFRAEGANVIIADVNMELAREVEAQTGAIAVRTDVTMESSVEACVAEAVRRFGGLDFMINNAGIIFVAPVIETTVEQWRRLMDINVTGVFLGSKVAAKQMIAQGRGGVIINASSGAGRRGSAYFAAYCASKAAIINFSQALAIEVAKHRIRVNCYTPGHIKTPFWIDIAEGYSRVSGMTTEEVIAMFERSVPWGRFGEPADVAAAVSWLCLDEAEYVSGQAIGMNGAELPW
ncbi:MAG: SDR family oxidoreductase [Dehalococcoidia bacterium]|nr:SDR family oxidoreductase [Dehalococcoidia bacterium]